MQRVLVLDNQRQPLSPTSPARARILLRKGKAAVFRRFPFTIILINRTGGYFQPVELRLDPGSKTTGVALVQQNKDSDVVVFAAELHHRGHQIKFALDSRRAIRRNRRTHKTRYRKPRFYNRTRPAGWLPPSLNSRVDNCFYLARRLMTLAPIGSIAVETVRFDQQKIENPEISGVEYQRGTLFGFELKEYLLEKWNRICAYCGKTGVPLEIEHVVAKRNGGTNRVSNLVMSCRECNEKKKQQPIREFLQDKPALLAKILAQLKRPLKDAAAVNSTRYAIGDRLKEFGLPVSIWSGGRTKYNRTEQQYPKAHWIDAACVGDNGNVVRLDPTMPALQIKATGRGSRQMCRMDRFGFPRTSAKGLRLVKGFKTGDLVKAIVPSGKKQGTHIGRVAVRSNGSFNISTTTETVQGIGYKYCRRLHIADGYHYQQQSA